MLFSERPPSALAEHTGFLMTWCAQRSRRHFAARVEAECDLDPREFGTLSVLARDPGRTQQALCAEAGVDPSSMVAMLDGLERRGLAERRPDPTDRRKHAVHLTAKGRQAVEDAQHLAARVGDEVFAPLTPAEREELGRLLRKLAGVDGGRVSHRECARRAGHGDEDEVLSTT